MRYRVAREGVKTVLGVTFEEGSLEWDDKPLAVTWSNDFADENIIGNAKDLQREEDGWITAEVEWRDTDKAQQVSELVGKEAWLTIYGNKVMADPEHKERPDQVIMGITLRAFFVTLGENPWLEWTE